MNDGIRRLAIPLSLITDYLFDYVLHITIESDASAAIGAVRNGFGPMIYMAKTQRISHAFLHDFFEDPERDHEKIGTDDNESDMLTKALFNPRFAELRESSGFWAAKQRDTPAAAHSARWMNATHRLKLLIYLIEQILLL